MIDDATLAEREHEVHALPSTHGEWLLEAHAEIRRLREDLKLLTNRNEPEPHALHYDECPYKPFADLASWEEPENPPTCTCSEAHKGAYWKARWMLTKGWRHIAERDLAAHQAVVRQASKLVDLLGGYVEVARKIKPDEPFHQQVEAEWKEFQTLPLVVAARREGRG